MYKNYVKRILDFLISLMALPFVLLIILIMAPLIYFDDKGPVFYLASRRGKNGKNFKMIKLRSMYVNSPNIKNKDGSTFNSANDPRVTRIGKLMRKTSIDEIPQLLNVLKGDMSLIGPRPTLPSTPYEELDDIRKKRLRVKPGITGYSQAYYRNSISMEEKFKYDCYYAENISFLLDMKILFKTIGVVIRRKNIYITEDKSEQTMAVK